MWERYDNENFKIILILINMLHNMPTHNLLHVRTSTSWSVFPPEASASRPLGSSNTPEGCPARLHFGRAPMQSLHMRPVLLLSPRRFQHISDIFPRQGPRLSAPFRGRIYSTSVSSNNSSKSSFPSSTSTRPSLGLWFLYSPPSILLIRLSPNPCTFRQFYSIQVTGTNCNGQRLRGHHR